MSPFAERLSPAVIHRLHRIVEVDTDAGTLTLKTPDGKPSPVISSKADLAALRLDLRVVGRNADPEKVAFTMHPIHLVRVERPGQSRHPLAVDGSLVGLRIIRHSPHGVTLTDFNTTYSEERYHFFITVIHGEVLLVSKDPTLVNKEPTSSGG